jgi:hypothetical protein
MTTIWTDIAKRWPLAAPATALWAELKSNRRAVAGLLLIAALLAGYGVVALEDAAGVARTTYSHELANLARVIAVGRELDWPAHAEESTAARKRFEARLWTAESEGVARADIQDWIGVVCREVGLQTLDVRIDLSKPADLPADLRRITATIAARPAEKALVALLERIDRSPRLLVIDRLNVRQAPDPMLEMVLVGYARIGAAGRNSP